MNPLATQLRDIHLPESVSWWPPAPGYWLILLLVALIMLSLYLIIRYRQRRVIKRAALTEFNKIKRAYQRDQDDTQLVVQLSALLRRAAISSYPREQCASLTGGAWLNWLDSTLKGSTPLFANDIGQLLSRGPYTNIKVDNGQTALLLDSCEHWLKQLPARGAGRDRR